MTRIYYIAELDFTNNNASTSRVLHNSLSISASNKFQVTLVGYGNVKEYIKSDFQIKNVKKGEGILLKSFYYIFRGFFIINLLKKEKAPIDIIIFYGFHTRILFPLLKYSRKNGIKLISDVVEWYDYSHLPMGRFGFSAWDVHIGLTRLVIKCDGVIVISSFLENFYRDKGKITLRIPVTIDTSEVEPPFIPASQFDSNYLNLIYAGTPGKKDLIFDIIDVIRELNEENIAVRFHLLGPEKSDLEKKYPYLDKNIIICQGKIPQDQVASYLRQADFSVLLRPKKRYAQAGFPTKFVESLNSGLPVIANLTSDLSLYLRDGVNGFVVNDITSNELRSTILKAIETGKMHLKEMKCNAKDTAKQYFDYRIFTSELETFLAKIILCK